MIIFSGFGGIAPSASVFIFCGLRERSPAKYQLGFLAPTKLAMAKAEAKEKTRPAKNI